MSRNALAIHLEDWFHTGLLAPYVGPGRTERRVAWAAEPILALLERRGVRATFFVLGDVLRHHPELVRRLHAEGHEIGCYGWRPRPVRTLAPERFAQDLEDYDRAAAQVLPVQEIVGFRAPGFGLDATSGWALAALAERGYRYDASMHPVRTSRYGVAGVPLAPYRPTPDDPLRDHPAEAFWEFPPTAWSLGGVELPVANGLGLRVTPLPLLYAALESVQRSGRPISLTLSPWETDLGTPVPPSAPLWVRAATRAGARRVLAKLEALLAAFSFGPLREALELPGVRNDSRHSES